MAAYFQMEVFLEEMDGQTDGQCRRFLGRDETAKEDMERQSLQEPMQGQIPTSRGLYWNSRIMLRMDLAQTICFIRSMRLVVRCVVKARLCKMNEEFVRRCRLLCTVYVCRDFGLSRLDRINPTAGVPQSGPPTLVHAYAILWGLIKYYTTHPRSIVQRYFSSVLGTFLAGEKPPPPAPCRSDTQVCPRKVLDPLFSPTTFPEPLTSTSSQVAIQCPVAPASSHFFE